MNNKLLKVDNTGLVEASAIEKLERFLDCIESIETKDGVSYIKYRSNVMEIYPENHVKLVNGIDVSIANIIHLNPPIEVKEDLKQIIEDSEREDV